jgi:orotidine-5'-phosphate decarboxylase
LNGASNTVIRNGVEMLTQHPYLGRSVEREIRELVISFGRTE